MRWPPRRADHAASAHQHRTGSGGRLRQRRSRRELDHLALDGQVFAGPASIAHVRVLEGEPEVTPAPMRRPAPISLPAVVAAALAGEEQGTDGALLVRAVPITQPLGSS